MTQEKTVQVAKRPFRPEPGRINVIMCMKLMVLWLLAHPKEVGERVPYPKRRRRQDHPNYWSAYQANGGWTGQELAELIAHELGTKWKPNNWLMYHAVLGGESGLAHYEWVKFRMENPDQPHSVAWYRLNDDPFGDPPRPSKRALEQDKENLAEHLKDVVRFVKAIDDRIYGGQLLAEFRKDP